MVIAPHSPRSSLAQRSCSGCAWTVHTFDDDLAERLWAEAHTDEITVHVTVRVRLDGRAVHGVQNALLTDTGIHDFPGYRGAEVSRVIRRDPAGTPHPYPLDTPQENR